MENLILMKILLYPITKIISKNFKHRFDILFSNKEIFLHT